MDMSGVKKPVNQAKIKAVPDFCPIIKTQAANRRLNERLLPPKIPSKQPKAAKNAGKTNGNSRPNYRPNTLKPQKCR